MVSIKIDVNDISKRVLDATAILVDALFSGRIPWSPDILYCMATLPITANTKKSKNIIADIGLLP